MKLSDNGAQRHSDTGPVT